MRTQLLIVLLLALSAGLFAQSPVHADANLPAEAEIKALETKLADLIVHAGWDEYAGHLAADYLHTRDNGRVENKDEALAALRDEKRKIIVMEMEPSDAVVHIYGDSALANAEFAVSVRESGQVKNRRVRVTSVFVRKDGQWWLAAAHDSIIGK